HRRASDLVVAPLLHDQVLQALELESVAALSRELNLQTVGLLADAQLATDLELAFAIAAPGRKALGVAPAELALLGAHVGQRVAHYSARAQWLVAIQIVDHAAAPALARIGQEAVAHLQPVQMHHLEIAHVDSPVRVLSLRYKLHQVTRTALVEQVLRCVGAQSRRSWREAFLIDALITIKHRAFHLVLPRVVGLRRGQGRPIPGVGQSSAIKPLGRWLRFHILVVIGENIRDSDAGPIVSIHAGRVGRGNFLIT
ncbi:mCG144782, partial [Mus musculus]